MQIHTLEGKIWTSKKSLRVETFTQKSSLENIHVYIKVKNTKSLPYIPGPPPSAYKWPLHYSWTFTEWQVIIQKFYFSRTLTFQALEFFSSNSLTFPDFPDLQEHCSYIDQDISICLRMLKHWPLLTSFASKCDFQQGMKIYFQFWENHAC